MNWELCLCADVFWHWHCSKHSMMLTRNAREVLESQIANTSARISVHRDKQSFWSIRFWGSHFWTKQPERSWHFGSCVCWHSWRKYQHNFYLLHLQSLTQYNRELSPWHVLHVMSHRYWEGKMMPMGWIFNCGEQANCMTVDTTFICNHTTFP
jgi:hypothetical protein